MKLTRIEVKNFRSFAGTDIRLTDGMNALVGPNNCGKSNLVRALRMAFDPEYPFDPVADVPGQLKYAFPRTTLTFDCSGATSSESTLMRYLNEYEKTVSSSTSSTYADAGVVRFVVTYRGGKDHVTRQEYFAARGGGDRRGKPELNEKALRQFRKVMKFIAVDSGQSIEELLTGRFREILHTVLKEELKQHLDDAELARKDYVQKLESKLLSPMRDRTLAISKRLFPEVTEMFLTPTVSGLEETLSNVEIRLVDSVETELRNKGTGVAGAILVALLRYLTEASKHSMVLAVEEPEAFLHPGAQERLREDLEALAEKDKVTLLITTHSPYILSRHPKAQVVAIEKSAEGISAISGTARGSEPHSPALSGLFRDLAVPRLLDRYNTIPAGSRGVLLVEGTTDGEFLAIAADKLGRGAALKDVHIIPNRGTDSLVLQAVLLRAETDQPIWVLLDSDENGRHAREMLIKRFSMKTKDVLEYGRLVGANYCEDAEAEWLFPSTVMAKFVQEYGEHLVLKSKEKRFGAFRYDFTPEGKESFPEWIRKKGKKADLAGWGAVLDAIEERLVASAS